jgi:hypothetical protein
MESTRLCQHCVAAADVPTRSSRGENSMHSITVTWPSCSPDVKRMTTFAKITNEEDCQVVTVNVVVPGVP